MFEMAKFNFIKFIKDTRTLAVKYSPEILTGIGIAGMITTTVLAVKATPKAMKLIDAKKKEEHKDKLTAGETVEVAWKPYVPAVVTGVASTACLIGASRVNYKRNAALATAYQLSTTALSEYKDQVIETVGEVKEKEIREKVQQKQLDKEPSPRVETVFVGNDDVLFYDVSFGTLFSANLEDVRAAINNINYQMLSNEYASLNEFYDELGVRRIDIGETLGWNISKTGKLDISISSTITAPNGKPAIALEYHVAPYYDYWKSH